MSLLRIPTLECDACHRPSRNHIGFPWMTAQDLRTEAARSGWTRRGRQDLCPHCAGYYDDRTCACGRTYCGYEPVCPTCSGDALPDPPKTLDDYHRDELRLARLLP